MKKLAVYQARAISRDRARTLKKTGALKKGILLEAFQGPVIVEPTGSNMGDGPLLPRVKADLEICPAWCSDAVERITEARRLLGLGALAASSS